MTGNFNSLFLFFNETRKQKLSSPFEDPMDYHLLFPL